MHIEGLPTKTTNLLEEYGKAYKICRDNNKLNLQEEINKVFKDIARSGEIYFFHGSKNPDLTLLEPREVGKRSETDGPLVFATNFIGLAASFIMSTRDDACIKSGFDFHNPQQKPIVIFKNKNVIVNNDCGGAIYVCNPNLDWQISLDKGFGINECTCNKNVDIIGRIPVKFAIEEMYKGGIEIFIADDESFRYLREQMNKGEYRDYELAIIGENFGVDKKFTLQKVNDSGLEQLKNDIITRREILGLQESLEKELEQIDKEYYGGKAIEITYFDLIIQYINYAKEHSLEEAQNSLDFRWLGSRRRILLKLINKQIPIEQIFTEYLDLLKNILKEKKQYYEEHDKHYFHGSSNSDIETFEPRKDSEGDPIPLVYAAYCRTFSLSFIFNKKINHKYNPIIGKTIPEHVYYQHTLKDLLSNDVGGTMYEFSGEAAQNFSYDLAKETYEVVSKTPVKPTEKQKIISTLNELVFNNEDFRIFYGEDERSPQELTLKDLYIVRQQYIEKLAKNPLGNTELIARLKEQQENLLSLAEQNGRKEEMDKIIKDYKKISFSRNSACILQ